VRGRNRGVQANNKTTIKEKQKRKQKGVYHICLIQKLPGEYQTQGVLFWKIKGETKRNYSRPPLASKVGGGGGKVC